MKIADGLKIDTNIYDRNRLFRLNNTKNRKSGLYKVQISPLMLGGSIDVITEYAKCPQVEAPFGNDYESVVSLKVLYETCCQQSMVKSVRPTSTPFLGTTGNINKCCVLKMMNQGVPDGVIHDSSLRLVVELVKGGLADEAILEEMEAWATKCDPPAVEDFERMLDDCRKRDYDFGCNDPILKSFCDTSCSFHKKTSDIVELPGYISELNAEYFVSRDGSKTVVCRRSFDTILKRSLLIRSSFADFKSFYGNRQVITGNNKNGPIYTPLGSAWLTHPQRRQYDGIIMSPGGDVAGQYNLWQGFAVKPIRGNWPLMHNHIKEVICDNDDKSYHFLMGWMARMIQLPGVMGEVAIVLQGGRGTGKGFLGNSLSSLMGQHSCHVTNSKHITGNFNAHLEDCIFLFADESFWAGDKQAENVLKGLITEPTIPIERKGFDLKTVPNMLHILMASNNEWVVPAGVDERRYCVIKVSDRYVQNFEYFGALANEINNGGLEAMLFDLQQMDIKNFEVRKVPNTVGLLEQKIQSLDTVMSWWLQKLQDGTLLPGYDWEPVPNQALYDDYCTRTRKLGGSVRCTPQNNFGKTFPKILPKLWPKNTKKVANDPYNNHRMNHYVFPSIEICREKFEEVVGSKIEWPVMSE